MGSYTYANRTYTQVDTTFNGDVAVKLDELSGRQGDNMRTVYLQLVQTVDGANAPTPWNLDGYTVELGGMDSQGRVKLTNTATVTNSAKGLVALSVPGAFYQVVGDYQSAYLRIMQGSTVVSTVNVAMSVYQDGLALTSGESVNYIGQVSQLVAQANALIDPLTTKIESASSATDAVSTAVKAYQTQLGSTGVAKTGSNNTFTGTQTFDQIVANSIGGDAWGKIQALVASNFSNTGNSTQGIEYVNGATGSLTKQLVQLGPIHMLAISGSMSTPKALAPWGDRVEVVKFDDLDGVQSPMMMLRETPADLGIVLWYQMNGSTLSIQNIAKTGSTANVGWIFQLSQMYIW